MENPRPAHDAAEASAPAGPLRASELAEAAILGDLAVGLHVLSWVLPFGLLIQAASATPIAALAVRHRRRAVVVGIVSGASVAFLAGGFWLAVQTVVTGVIGLSIGTAARRHWGVMRTVAMAVGTGGIGAAMTTVVTLAALSHLRRLALDQLHLSWQGFAHLLQRLHLDGVVSTGDRVVSWCLDHWWVTLPATEILAVAALAAAGRALAVPLISRLAGAAGERAPSPPITETGGPPVLLERVSFRYPGSTLDALHDVTTILPAGAFVTVTGSNGSGKSTLARVVAGMAPTSGVVTRQKPATPVAMVFQRPESQVLGCRVRDDVVWGMPAAADNVDPLHPPAPDAEEVSHLLALVGLGGMETRETSTLSGGELQRLALAAALARRPRLVVSDESTTMLDGRGRREVIELLRALPGEAGLSVLHVTHREEETAGASAHLALDRGRLVPPGPSRRPVDQPDRARTTVTRRPPGTGRLSSRNRPRLLLEGVEVVYSPGSPWSHRALRDVDLGVGEGEAVVVTGSNGSGKSTLAWVMAGLLLPTEGSATFDGRPLTRCVGRVGLAFQHARLQLFRPTVESELAFGREPEDASVDRALEEVGLEPGEFRRRRIDELSGGEQRRVALATLVARRTPVIVLDEPFAGLDDEGITTLVDLLTRLRTEEGVATVVVSHDLELAPLFASRQVALEGGRIVADGPRALSRSAP